MDNAASRFGNPAFKTFYDKVQQVRTILFSFSPHPPPQLTPTDLTCGTSYRQAAPQLHESLLVQPADAITEMSGYFCQSWGNRTRIDYGSGMELNFICWLCVVFAPCGGAVHLMRVT